MRKLSVFNQVSVDGYFKSADGGVGWMHEQVEDAEFTKFVAGNASGGGTLLFGRKTYETMASFWPTPMAAEQFPVVAKQMNALPKLVFSRTLPAATWSNTTLHQGDLEDTVRRLKSQPGDDIAILGSGSLVAQLTRAGLIDAFQIVVLPVVLGRGTTMFEGVDKQSLRLTHSRPFGNGIVLLEYEPRR